jgi:hypothetical protein
MQILDAEGRRRHQGESERKFIDFDIQVDGKIKRAFGGKKANLSSSRDLI